MKVCGYCKKPVEEYHNYCGWACMIEEAKANGGKVSAPNGLPIGSIDRDGNMWEHEHGDHPDYKFPVTIEYVGGKPEEQFRVMHGDGTVEPMSKEWADARSKETHALIYTDGYVALTIYECTYAMWSLKDGSIRAGQMWKKGDWKLADESITKIMEMKR